MTSENRKSTRRSTNASFLVYNSETEQLVGRVLNMSPDGLLMASEDDYGLDTTIPCRLDFPYWHKLRQFVTFYATSRWCQKNLHLDWYESGWNIHHLSDSDRKIIEEVIQDWEIKDNFGTFRISASETE